MTERSRGRAQALRITRRGLLRRSVLAGAGLSAAALIGCGGTSPPSATPSRGVSSTVAPTATGTLQPYAHIKRGGTLRIAASSEPSTLDPYAGNYPATKSFAAYVYSRLYKVGARADLNPNSALPDHDLAESAESPDGRTWLVRLRKGARFHDVSPVNGRLVRAEDVVYSWRRLTAAGATGAWSVTGVNAVEAVDETTLRFTLEAPTATFLDVLADANLLWVMPVESEGGFDPKQVAIGSGPWVLNAHRPGGGFEFRRHGGYFIDGKPFVDGVKLAIVPDYAERLSKFESGATHVETIQSEDVVALRRAQTDVQWRGLVPALLSYLAFSSQQRDPNAPWRDDRFRQAVSMALDRDALTELGYNTAALKAAKLDVATTWSNLVPAGFTRWWLDPRSKHQGPSARFFEFHATDARKLLEATGAVGAGFTYQYPSNRYGDAFNAIAEATASSIAQIGLRPSVEQQDYNATYMTHTATGDFSGVAFGYETPFPEVGSYFLRMFGEDPANRGKVRDARIGQLDQRQRVELDERKRRELIWEIQRVNDDHMYYVPNQAGAGTQWTAYRPEVRGIVQTRGYGAAAETLINLWLDV